MRFLVSVFSSENCPVSATGSWRVTADTVDQAVTMARFYADSRFWRPGSTWLCIPLDESPGQWEAGVWNPSCGCL